MLVLWLQAHVAQDVLEARIASERVKPGIHPSPHQSIRAFVVGLFEPLKRLSRLAEARENARHIE